MSNTVIVSGSSPNRVTVSEVDSVRMVIVTAAGPQGAKGDQGDVGPAGPIVGVPVFIQASQPTEDRGPYLWLDISNGDLQIKYEDGIL